MLAVAEAIESAGGSVRLAGGGAGQEFVRLNGYDAFEPTTVDFIDTYQGGSVWQTAKRSLPASLGRIADYQAWLSATEPDALVTDDMFAAMAASRCGVPLYVVKHDMPGLYEDRLERVGASFHTLFQLSAAREFFYPVVWPASGVDPTRSTRIPPLALDEPDERVAADAPDVMVVPSHYSELSRITDHLRRQGYDVVSVASDDWEPTPSLLPYLRGARVVVCSGYSTIMDCAVAGTPCVVHPATDEQRAVADRLDTASVSGFTVAPEPLDVLDAVHDPPAAPDFTNGADVIARRVLTDLRDPDPYAEESADGASEDVGRPTGRVVSALPTLAAAGVVTAAMLPSVAGGRIRRLATAGRAATRRLWAGSVSTARSVGSGRTIRAAADRLGGVASGASRSVRRLAGRCRSVVPARS